MVQLNSVAEMATQVQEPDKMEQEGVVPDGLYSVTVVVVTAVSGVVTPPQVTE